MGVAGGAVALWAGNMVIVAAAVMAEVEVDVEVSEEEGLNKGEGRHCKPAIGAWYMAERGRTPADRIDRRKCDGFGCEFGNKLDKDVG